MTLRQLLEYWEDYRDAVTPYIGPALFALLISLTVLWWLNPTAKIMRLLGPSATKRAARIIVFAVVFLAPAVFLTEMLFAIRPWIAITFALVCAGLCATLAGAEQDRFREVGQADMIDILDLMSRSLRVGMSLEQVVNAVAAAAHGPVGRAMRRVSHAAALGRDLPVVLTEQAAQLGLREFGVLAAIIALHRETGGSLAERLAAQLETISRRRHLDSKLRLAAMQVTLQANILIVFLFILIAQTSVLEPRNLAFLLQADLGRQMLIGSMSLAGAGWLTIWGLLRMSLR